MKTYSGVYKIKSRSTGKFYYGSSQDIKKRKARHLKDLRLGTHHNAKLQKIYAKHGEDDLRFILVKEFKCREDSYILEDKLIKKHTDNKKSLNIGMSARGGDNLTRNVNRSQIIAKMAQSSQMLMDSLTKIEKKERFGRPGKLNGMYGKTHTAKARKLVSDANKGHTRSRGIKMTDEAKRNISEACKRKVASPDYVNPFAGKQHSKETLKLLRRLGKERTAKGFLPPNARKIKIGKKVYASLTEASRQVGVVAGTIHHRIKSPNYPNYKYLN